VVEVTAERMSVTKPANEFRKNEKGRPVWWAEMVIAASD
jgi:hypothetical protein